jgi:hypothetical protein
LRGLGGGGVGQNFGVLAPGAPAGFVGHTIRDRGGWGQINLRPSTMFLVGGGCGVDDPRDFSAPARSRNQACEGHVQLRPASMLVIGFEGRAIATEYLNPFTNARSTARSTHLNLALGVEF